MRKTALWLIWPGLAPLWLKGSGRGLAAAAAFGCLLNFTLITTFIWPQLLSRELAPWIVPAAAWVLVLWFWIVAARITARFLAQEAARRTPPDDDANRLLVQAQTEYLKGHLSQAESLLQELLTRFPGDCEARLLLATLCRRIGRPSDARKHLAELLEQPQAHTWRMEIEIEHRTLTRSASEGEQPLARAA
ncbi:MAG: tetratricopeptide repeat protein [Planctomycetales bacterium]|nr:tetratricopeptide repeat protein [Planctomycetales bacterium]